MGCNRLAVGEDREAADLARSEHIPYRQALMKIVARRYEAALQMLAQDQQRMDRLKETSERAAEAAVWSRAVINHGGQVYSDMGKSYQMHKSDYGEGATALKMYERGFEPVMFGTLYGKGIDSIWVKDGSFYIVESKSYGSNLTRAQMTHDWINNDLARM